MEMQILLDKLFATLIIFKHFSGLKINYDESLLFPLGTHTSRKPAFIKDFAVICLSGPVILLGVSFSTNRGDLFPLSFPPKLSP